MLIPEETRELLSFLETLDEAKSIIASPDNSNDLLPVLETLTDVLERLKLVVQDADGVTSPKNNVLETFTNFLERLTLTDQADGVPDEATSTVATPNNQGNHASDQKGSSSNEECLFPTEVSPKRVKSNEKDLGKTEKPSKEKVKITREDVPLRNPSKLRKGVIYRSTISRNSQGMICATGHGYNRDGTTYKAGSTGRVHDMRKPPPGLCFNCERRPGLSRAEKLHWRFHCPRAVGNPSIPPEFADDRHARQ